MKIEMLSSLSGERHYREIDITLEQYCAWKDAEDDDPIRFVQNAFPHLSAEDREYLISGITPEEWDGVFDSDEDYIL